MKINKKISKIKLTLTTNCNLACDYCFVKKTNERMSFDVAKKSIDLLLNSPGNEKLLSLYGGEPLFMFSLIKQIVVYSQKLASKNKKKLTISICTNLTFINEEIKRFIKENSLKITISVVGVEKDHNKFRSFINGVGSHQKVIENIKEIFKILPAENIGISFVVLPELSSRLLDNIQYIDNLKISNKNINLEIIQDYKKWDKDSIENFKNNYKKISQKLLNNIAQGRKTIFFNIINWELEKKAISKRIGNSCPFDYLLEIYPSGDIAFSPFLLNKKNKKDFIIGNVKELKLKRYNNCQYIKDDKRCQQCQQIYFQKNESFDNANKVKMYYDIISLATARIIQEKEKSEEVFKRYVIEAKKRCF